MIFSGVRGKPRLALDAEVEFNLSHSDDMALVGFTARGEIGVDIEKIRVLEDMGNLAQRFFCSAEFHDLESVDIRHRGRAFFCCWTRKEAYLKAVGDGLHTPLDSFRVTLRPGEPARMLQINGRAEAASRWSLYTVDVIPPYAAAVAHLGEQRSLRLMPVVTPAALLLLDNRS